MARQIARLIAIALAAFAFSATSADVDLKTPQTPWRSLSPEQQRVLGPVAHEWDAMPGYQQQRLMNTAKRYPNWQPIQKERFDQRVRDWAAMSPDQRKAARETFQGLRRLPPEKQHELRERWLQQHPEAAGMPGPGFSPRDQQAPGSRQRGEPQQAPGFGPRPQTPAEPHADPRPQSQPSERPRRESRPPRQRPPPENPSSSNR